MNYVLLLLFLFYIGSVFGWILELIYRRMINQEHKWVNPGFLVGPYLPLYGFGLTFLFLIACTEGHIPIANEIIKKIVLFAIMAVMMTVLEYIAGVIFIKKMKIKLWDYSGMWGNIQGIICPLYSVFWAILGAIYYLFLHSHIIKIVNDIFSSTALALGVGVFYGFFIIDLVYSLQLMVKIRSFAKEHDIVIKMQELKLNIVNSKEEAKRKWKLLFALSSHSTISAHLNKYRETAKKLELKIKK